MQGRTKKRWAYGLSLAAAYADCRDRFRRSVQSPDRIVVFKSKHLPSSVVGLFLKYAMKVPVFLNKLQFSGMAWAYIKFVERKFLPFRKSVEL